MPDFMQDLATLAEMVDQAEQSKVHAKGARLLLDASKDVVKASAALEDVIPATLAVAAPLSDDQVKFLTDIVGAATQTDEMKALRTRIESGLNVHDMLNLDDETQGVAGEVLKQYDACFTKQAPAAASPGSGVSTRKLGHPIQVTGPNGWVINPSIGNFNSVRWQINQHLGKVNADAEISDADYVAVRTALAAWKVGDDQIVSTLTSDEGEEYTLAFPA